MRERPTPVVIISSLTSEGARETFRAFEMGAADVIEKPKITPYGSKEFKIEDIDGRIIGIGKVQDYDKFFKRDI